MLGCTEEGYCSILVKHDRELDCSTADQTIMSIPERRDPLGAVVSTGKELEVELKYIPPQ